MLPANESCTDHSASWRTASKSSANCAASSSPSLSNCTAEPRNGRKEATSLSWSDWLIRRCAKRSFSSSRARSAIAVFSCCFARSISTFCCAAFASDAAFCSPAKSLFALAAFISSVATWPRKVKLAWSKSAMCSAFRKSSAPVSSSFRLLAFIAMTVQANATSKVAAIPQFASVISEPSRSMEFHRLLNLIALSSRCSR